MTPGSESQPQTPRSPRRRWRRFRTNRLALGSLFLLGTLFLVTIVSLPFALSWYAKQNLDDAVRAPPSLTNPVEYRAMQPALETHPVGRWVKGAGPTAHAVASWMGHDALGRSLWYRCMLGWQVSLMIGSAAALLSLTIGVLWGATAALAGGRVDTLMMRIVDVLYGLPYILMVILLKITLTEPLRSLLGRRDQVADVIILVLAIGTVSWLTMARVIRGQVLSLREQSFVEASRAIGAGSWWVLRKHLLPNLIGPIVVYATLVIPQAILQESFLSFLGIGVQPPTPSLGRLAADGLSAVNTFVGFWWLITFPCALLVVTLLALNFLGDGLRDAFDPKSTASMLA